MREGDDLKEELSTELADSLSGTIEEVLGIVTSNTRFGDFKNLKNMDLKLTDMRKTIHSRQDKLRRNQKDICGKVFGSCTLTFPRF